MPEPSHDRSVMAVLQRSHFRLLLLALCAAGALRVFVFAGSFPLYTNIDEIAHLDLVYRFSEANWPAEYEEKYSRWTAHMIVNFGTGEYLKHPSDLLDGKYKPPMWKLRNKPGFEESIRSSIAKWKRAQNHEAQSPPSYYLLGGAWFKLGRAMGLRGGYLIYWLRFLNVILFALFIFAVGVFVRTGWPQRTDLQIAVPLIAAFIPQDVFYSINSDVLAPLLFTTTMILALRWYRATTPSLLMSAGLGALTAATFLVKFTNIALPLIVAAVVMAGLFRAFRTQRVGAVLLAAAMVGICALLPVALWLGRNLMLFDELAATESKLEFLGWLDRPLERYLDHPIFSFSGFATFWNEVIQTLWAGEISWHGSRLKDPVAMAFYSLSTTILLVTAALGSVRRIAAERNARRSDEASTERATEGLATSLCWASLGASVFCLAYLSVSFEYPRSFYPSAEFPYLASGRLIAGTIVAMLVLWVQGVAVLFSPFPALRVAGPVAVAALVVVGSTISEVVLSWPVFPSAHNFFHLP